MQHAHSITLQVCESDRLSFLPDMFGDDFLSAEMQVYSLADRYLPQYTGGFWLFIRCWVHHDRGNAGLVQLLMQREEQLWNYIETHPERGDIIRALD